MYLEKTGKIDGTILIGLGWKGECWRGKNILLYKESRYRQKMKWSLNIILLSLKKDYI